VSFLAGLFSRRRIFADLSQEVRAHLDEKVDELVAGGMPRADAVRVARREFGNVTTLEEEARDVWRWPSIESIVIDVRVAVRMLAKAPVYTLVAIVTLALGIGANTAMFSAVNAVLLHPLPFPRSDRLVQILSTKDGVSTGPSALDARDFARESRAFDKLVVYDTWRKNLSAAPASADPEQIRVGLVPAEYFDALGVSPVLGRLFAADENRWGNHHVAVLTTTFWQSHFGGDGDVLGKIVRINAEGYTIVGIVPDAIPSWMDPRNEKVGVFTPFAPDADVWSESSRGGRGFATIGLLKPGVTLPQAEADLAAIAARLAQRHPIDEGFGVTVEPLAQRRIGTLRPTLLLLMAAVGLMLLIACANVANLLLARNGTRRHEFAIRTALGAGRGRLVRQLLTEMLLLSLAGGAVGVALAWLGTGLLSWLHPAKISQLAEAQIDTPVLLFTLVISVATSVGFGILPALAGTRVRATDALSDGGRTGSAGRRRRSLSQALVIAEVALSLMLLIGAGLILQSLLRLREQNLGFRQDHLLTEHLFLPDTRYSGPERVTAFCDRFAGRIRAIPGVSDATITDIVPPSYRWKLMFTVIGRPAADIASVPAANFGVTDSRYVRTLGIRVLRGRDFTDADAAAGARVVLVNDAFARRYFGAEDPVGKELDLAAPETLVPRQGAAPRLTIIGVIDDAKNRGLAQSADPDIIGLYRQNPEQNFGFKSVIVRTTIEPSAIAPALRRELAALDPDLPFAEVRTMGDILSQETADGRFSTLLLAIFAGLGVTLAVVGVYGVVSYGVSQRRREIATRIVLGAPASAVIGLVVREGLSAGILGIALGLVGAGVAAQVASSLLYGVSPSDPLTFAGCASLLALVVLVATLVPGRRAATLDPLEALRND
jgi:putative ABC transport system permease protein